MLKETKAKAKCALNEAEAKLKYLLVPTQKLSDFDFKK